MKSNTNPSTVPMARDANGNGISLPDGAAAWGVRRHTGGRPRNVIGLDRRPLRLPLDTTVDDLEAMLGPGTYRLDLVDENGAPLGVTVPVIIGDQSEGDEDDDPPASRVDRDPPPLVTLPTSGTDLRLLLEANVRAMQLSFHHNERTLETSLRVVDSLRDGVRVLADAQAEWIKSLASNHSIRNAPYWPPPRPQNDNSDDDDDDGDDDESDDQDDEEEEDPTFWQQLGDHLNPYAPLIMDAMKDRIARWVGGAPIRNANARKDASTTEAEKPAAPPKAAPDPTTPPPPATEAPSPRQAPQARARKKTPSHAELMGMVAQKIHAAKKILTEEEITLLRHFLTTMPEAERDRWVAELAPLSVEDAVVRIRRSLSQIGTPPDQPATEG